MSPYSCINASKSIFSLIFFKNAVSLSQKKSEENSVWGIYPSGKLHVKWQTHKGFTYRFTQTYKKKGSCLYININAFIPLCNCQAQINRPHTGLSCLGDRLYFCLNGHNLHNCNNFYILSFFLWPAYSHSSQSQNSHSMKER